jgi:hypothetical protein
MYGTWSCVPTVAVSILVQNSTIVQICIVFVPQTLQLFFVESCCRVSLPFKRFKDKLLGLGFRAHGHPTTMGAGFKVEGGVHRLLIFCSFIFDDTREGSGYFISSSSCKHFVRSECGTPPSPLSGMLIRVSVFNALTLSPSLPLRASHVRAAGARLGEHGMQHLQVSEPPSPPAYTPSQPVCVCVCVCVCHTHTHTHTLTHTLTLSLSLSLTHTHTHTHTRTYVYTYIRCTHRYVHT